jgi:hypothetical protein
VFAETYKFVRIFPLGQYDVDITPVEMRPIERTPSLSGLKQPTESDRRRSMSITDTEADVMMLAAKSTMGNHEEDDRNMVPQKNSRPTKIMRTLTLTLWKITGTLS